MVVVVVVLVVVSENLPGAGLDFASCRTAYRTILDWQLPDRQYRWHCNKQRWLYKGIHNISKLGGASQASSTGTSKFLHVQLQQTQERLKRGDAN